MAKDRKKIDLESLDVSHYLNNEDAKIEDTKEESIGSREESEMAKDIKHEKNKIKKKLIRIPEMYEINIKEYIRENSTPYHAITVQSFIVQAIEEKLINLGY